MSDWLFGWIKAQKGGSGSGNWGHGGRPGMQGGSLPGRVGAGFFFDDSELKAGQRMENIIESSVAGREDNVLIADESDRIVEELKDEYGEYDEETFEQFDYDYVSEELYAWSADGHDEVSAVLHVAASKEFDSPLSDFTKKTFLGDVNADFTDEQRLIKHIYDDTQISLRSMGVNVNDKVVLYRGKVGTPPFVGSGKASGNALESWTTSSKWARFYVNRNSDIGDKGYVVASAVPANRILALPHTGMGLGSVSEVVILGGNPLDVQIQG